MAGDRRRLVRIWLVGIVCLVAGVTATAVFVAHAPPSDRVGAAEEVIFVVVWYAAGLLLLAVDLRRVDPFGNWTALGWTIWLIGVLCCCGSVVRLAPE
jgi:hypothetical protein